MSHDLIAGVYEALDHASPIEAMASHLRTHLRSLGVMFRFARTPHGGGGRFIFDASAETRRKTWPLYNATYRKLDPSWQAHYEPGDVLDFKMLRRPECEAHRRYYDGFCRHIGAAQGLVAFLGQSEGSGIWLSVARSEAEGPFTTSDVRLVRHAIPHLKRSATIWMRQERAKQKLAALLGSVDAMDAMHAGALVVDSDGNPVAASARTRALLKARDLMQGDRDEQLSPAFRRVLASLEAAGTSGSGGPRMLRVDDGGDGLEVALLRGGWNVAGERQSSTFMLRAHREQPPRSGEHIRSLFGLTRSEAALCAALCEGLSLEAAARRNGIRISTAQTYCKRTMSKIGASRQAEMVAIVLASLAALAPMTTPVDFAQH